MSEAKNTPINSREMLSAVSMFCLFFSPKLTLNGTHADIAQASVDLTDLLMQSLAGAVTDPEKKALRESLGLAHQKIGEMTVSALPQATEPLQPLPDKQPEPVSDPNVAAATPSS